MSDEYDDVESDDGDFHEAPETNPLSRFEEVVFCPQCDTYMPYHVEGALVRRRCPSCGKLFEGGAEVDPGKPVRAGKPQARPPRPPRPRTTAPAKRPTATKARGARPSARSADEGPVTCAALTKAGTPCSHPPRKGSKYCAQHRGWRPPR